MPISESRGRAGSRSRAQGPPYGANDLIGRLQQLLDTPRPVDGYPLEWFVEAWHLGDATALATLSLGERST
jgi:hypothetical protein